MNKADGKLRWSTSSFGNAPETSAIELAALGEHLLRCDDQRGSFFVLELAAQAVYRFAAPRLMTSLVLFAIVGTVINLLL